MTLGLVSALCEPEGLLEAAYATARKLSDKPRAAVRATKMLMRRPEEQLSARVDAEIALCAKLLEMPASKEMMTAFVGETAAGSFALRLRIGAADNRGIERAQQTVEISSISRCGDDQRRCDENRAGGMPHDNPGVHHLLEDAAADGFGIIVDRHIVRIAAQEIERTGESDAAHIADQLGDRRTYANVSRDVHPSAPRVRRGRRADDPDGFQCGGCANRVRRVGGGVRERSNLLRAALEIVIKCSSEAEDGQRGNTRS